MVDYLEYTAIPIQSPTTKELIEREATKAFTESKFTSEAGTKAAYISGFKQGFALSLPKQDNGDAWDEVIWHAEQLIKDLDGVFIGAIAQSTLNKLKTSISKIK